MEKKPYLRQMVAYKRLKTMENSVKAQPQKVVTVAYEEVFVSTVSNCSQRCSDLTGKILVFWIVDGRLWELNSCLRKVVSHRKGNPKTYIQYEA